MKRNFGKSIVMVLAIGLVLSVSAYGAVTTNVIVVTPSTEAALGWSHYITSFTASTQHEGGCGYSVAPAGAANAPGYGEGAFYGYTGDVLTTDPNDPSYPRLDVVNQVYLGTNNYSEVKLSDIKKLYYRSFTADYHTFDDDHWARTPWQLYLTVAKLATHTVPSRCFQYRGYDSVIDDTAHPGYQLCVPWSGEWGDQGQYMTFNGQNCYSGGNGAWINFWNTDGAGNRPWVGDWGHILTAFPEGRILAGSYSNGAWLDTWGIHDGSGHNPNNTCLTFAIGSPGDEDGGGSVNQVWQDNINMAAWLDYFIIGYNAGSDPANYTEDVIYFRPDGPIGKVAMNHKSTFDKSILDNPLGWKGNKVVLYGLVTSSPAPTSLNFNMIDGSGGDFKARVKLTEDMEYYPEGGSFVRVEGVLHRYGDADHVPDIFVHPDDVEIIVYPY